MSSSGTSSLRTPKFAQPQYFTHSRSKWFCNLCTPTPDHDSEGRKGNGLMTLQIAMQHERNSAEHAQKVTDTEIWLPASNSADWDREIQDVPLTMEEVRRREHQIHVDNVTDLVPFWIKGVEAAERGEVCRMEEFFENIKKSPWGCSGESWNYAYSSNWEVDGQASRWGRQSVGSNASMQTQRTASNTGRGKWKGKNSKAFDNVGSSAHAFVEGIARQVAADTERKRRMHTFFELPTEAKITKIEEVIQNLQKMKRG